MELIYKSAESAFRPSETEVGVTTVYFRRNFRQIERPSPADGEKPELIWNYEEAALTKDQAMYILASRSAELAQAVADDDAINIDHEYSLTLLELGLADN